MDDVDYSAAPRWFLTLRDREIWAEGYNASLKAVRAASEQDQSKGDSK